MLMLVQTPARAQQLGTRNEAQAMVDAAVEHARTVGTTQAFKDFSDRRNARWQKNDLYVFVYSMEGINRAHGANDQLIGKNLINLTDPSGKAVVRALRDKAAQGGGWVEYVWPNLQTMAIENKIAYTRKLSNDEGFVGASVNR